MFTLFLILGFYCPNLFFNFSFVTSHSFVDGNNLNFNDLCKNHFAVFCLGSVAAKQKQTHHMLMLEQPQGNFWGHNVHLITRFF